MMLDGLKDSNMLNESDNSGSCPGVCVARAKGRIEEVKLNTKKSRYKTAKEYPTVNIERPATATAGNGLLTSSHDVTLV